MRNGKWWLASALTAALVLVGTTGAQSQDKKGGDKKGGPAGRFGGRGGPGDGGFPPGGGFRAGGGIEKALADLKLSDKKKDQAEAAVKAYQENVRSLRDMARADLLLKLQDVLAEPEFKSFKVALESQPAAPPGGRGGRGGPGGRGGRGLTEDQIVERIMSFDKNGDGKITKDELPERMQDLIAKGDTNKDGALDKEEIKKLAATLAREGFPAGFGGRGGPGGPGGRGPGGRGGPGGGFGPAGGIEQRALDDVKLSDKTREQAETILKAHQENVRKLMDLPRADLLVKMQGILSESEYKQFKEATDRPPGPAPTSASRSADLEKKLDQLQKDLEALRREIRR
jgi:hypothetical protein